MDKKTKSRAIEMLKELHLIVHGVSPSEKTISDALTLMAGDYAGMTPFDIIMTYINEEIISN